jgi:hypothetical protein
MGSPIVWPDRSDDAAWSALANVALQLETLAADVAENDAWNATMSALVQRSLPYEQFTEQRLQALSDRVRRRKLHQTNLRYKYGFKPRSGRLVRRDVRAFLASNGIG